MIPKINKSIIWESCYIKIDFKVKDNEAKGCLTKNNDLLHVMFRGTPCIYIFIVYLSYFLQDDIQSHYLQGLSYSFLQFYWRVGVFVISKRSTNNWTIKCWWKCKLYIMEVKHRTLVCTLLYFIYLKFLQIVQSYVQLYCVHSCTL